MRLSVSRLLPWVVLAAAPAGAIAGPTSTAGEPFWEGRGRRLEVSSGLHVANAAPAAIGAANWNASWQGLEAVQWSIIAPGYIARALAEARLLDIVVPLSIGAGMNRLDAGAWLSTSTGARSQRKPLEGENREVELFPSLITFFCNPYRLDTGSMATGDGIGFRSDTRPEIDLGLMGRLSEEVRVALFSTLSTLAFTDELLSSNRKAVESEALTHRFALLLSVSPAKDLFLGAAGGAEVLDRPRSYVFELLFEARLQF